MGMQHYYRTNYENWEVRVLQNSTYSDVNPPTALYPSPAIGAIAEFRRDVDMTMGATLERRIMGNGPQVFFSDVGGGRVFFKGFAHGGVQLIMPAAAGGFDIIPHIPPKSGDEKHMQIPVELINLPPPPCAAGGAFQILTGAYKLFLVLYSKKGYNEHEESLFSSDSLLLRGEIDEYRKVGGIAGPDKPVG